MPVPLPLAQRTLLSLQDLLGITAADPTIEAARAALAALAFRKRDEDSALPANSLIVRAIDQGRYKLGLPIRLLRLELEIRSNSWTAAGAAASFQANCGALETWLDAQTGIPDAADLESLKAANTAGTPLQLGLSSATRGLAIMMARRTAGVTHSIEGQDIRKELYTLDLRAVGLEDTTAPS